MSSTPQQYITDVDRRPAGKLIGLDTQHSTPPVDAYVTVDDSLWIMVSCRIPSIVTTVIARILLPDGTIANNVWTAPNTNLATATYTQVRLVEGFILSISATAGLAGTAGNAFVALYLSRSLPGTFQSAQMLAQGYTYNNQPISWPGGVNQNSTDNAGNVRSITGTTPGAGANFSETVPGNFKWRITAMQFTFTASAAVATRTPAVTLDDGFSVFNTLITNNNVTAGQVATIPVIAQNASPNATVLVYPVPGLLGILLQPGYRIRSAIFGMQAGDQISALQYVVEEWLLP